MPLFSDYLTAIHGYKFLADARRNTALGAVYCQSENNTSPKWGMAFFGY
jgi:hypothetical protein